MSLPEPPATLAEVARAAGVHLSTASRVLHSSDHEARRAASEETAERIRRVALRLNYQRNPAGLRLRTNRSYEIAVVVPRLSDLVLATMYEGIQSRANARGYVAYVSNSQDDQTLREELAESAISRRVDGLIFGDATLDPSFLNGLRDRGVPVVLVNRRSGDHLRSTCDDTLGGTLVADHLAGLGHRRVAVIGGEPWASTSADRMAGFRVRCAELGVEIPDEFLITNGFDAHAGHEAALRCLRHPNPPSAIFAVNDFTAIGTMGALRSSGLVAGADVAVVGFNDTPLAAVLPIALSTVRSPMCEIGRGAADLLIDLLEGGSPESLTWRPELVVRESSSPPAR